MEKTEGVIRKVGNKWCIYSKKGKRLSCHPTREAAVKRLRQIEFFKHQKGSIAEVVAFLKRFGNDFEPEDFAGLTLAECMKKKHGKKKMKKDEGECGKEHKKK